MPLTTPHSRLAVELATLSTVSGDPKPQRSITWRSLLVGTLAAVAVCGLTPLNDFIFSDTSLVAGYLPLAAVLVMFVLIVGINGPLNKWWPKVALSSGELAIVVLMTLVACSLPNWGLMRFFIPTPTAPFHVGTSDPQFWKAFSALDLPTWLFPVESIEQGKSSDVTRYFFTRVPPGEAIPYGAWVRPLLAWGIFIAAMFATLTAIARMLFEQWASNERLPFPLVQVQAALVEPPEPGRGLNSLFRSRALWIGLGIVFAIHALSSLNAYYPLRFPKIPLGYDFKGLLPDPPLSLLSDKIKTARLSFIVIGATYFIRSRTSFSLWAIFLMTALASLPAQMRQGEVPDSARQDQHLGASIAFVLGILWIGRHHWGRILTLQKHRVAFSIAMAGVAVMIGWLCVVGVQWWMAGLIVLFILMSHLVVARVLAETGLPFYRSMLAVSQVYSQLPIKWFTGRDIYFAGVFTALGPLTTRDGVLGYTMHGMGVCREAGVEEAQARRLGGPIALALVAGFIVAAYATLYCQYSYPTPMAEGSVPARNYFGAEYVPKRDVAIPFVDYSRGQFKPRPNSTIAQAGIGFGATVLLQFCTLRWANWPLLPVGFVTSYGAFMGNAWFSVFVGWLAKVLIVRFGGAGLFHRARTFFIGIIFGEGLAAGFWLIVNAIVVTNGGNPQTIKFLF